MQLNSPAEYKYSHTPISSNRNISMQLSTLAVASARCAYISKIKSQEAEYICFQLCAGRIARVSSYAFPFHILDFIT